MFGHENDYSQKTVRFLLFTALALVVTSFVSSQPPVAVDLGPAEGGVEDAGPVVGTAAGMQNVLSQTAARPFQVGAAGDMIGFSHSDGSGTQTITLIHAGKSWMAVYHIDRSGMIRLVSSRPVDADFSLELNLTSPLPEEIRQMNQSR
ncbi:hypothetical protein [Novipirellula artificiosorum]|uniref:Uncharacterized protein n=1 Tax=Novipirellula artificiosorum TaxID=2528016 RepID=A0A5C6E0A4_9BACT|nr:hypothetical protein [Novipirellula artificiosorum]TWU42290.1 hypothetical protein Poly41_05860 [Novipirellula artificiosorum]